MNKRKKKLKLENFTRVYNLYRKQPWLCDKESALIELIELCKTNGQKDLLIDLLEEFKYLQSKELNQYLNLISDYIINNTGFEQDKTMIAAITVDEEADSSQRVLNDIKVPLYKKDWGDVNTVNRFTDIPKIFKKGKTQIVLIDEFIGAGDTALNRINTIKKGFALRDNFELKFCFLVGMDFGIKRIEELGYEVYCPLRLPKGISERYNDLELDAIEKMKELEKKLAPEINDHKLETFSLGYNNTQALYSLDESCGGNTPNSVFPIFWWPRYADNQHRENRLLTRVQKGF